jgi:aerobic carbon-monoxide dehydrogenase medium subunit
VARGGEAPARGAVEAAVSAAVPSQDAIDRKLLVAAVERCLAQVFMAEQVQ